jgi:two-component system response regulator HydG
MNILIVDDQKSARLVLKRILRDLEGVFLHEADSLDAAKTAIECAAIDLVLADIRLRGDVPDRGGLELLEWIRDTGRSTTTVMVTGSSELASIRSAMKLGAKDYVLKDDLSPEMLLPIVEGQRERLRLSHELQHLRRRVDERWGTAALVGSSPAMARVRKLVDRVADAEATVLIRGETGSGKELVARAIHQTSRRGSQPFVAVNCSTLPGTLVESMIFGHERGAFTGAERRVRGQLELAMDGTILLDEIAEMPIELQAKLLRVIEERRFRPLGSEQEVRLGARVLAATHVDLEERIAKGRFREDLYYRLAVVTIEVPSLADRIDDLPELMHEFLDGGERPLSFSAEAVGWLARRHWPGNVRELRNAIARLSLLAESDEIDVSTLQDLVGDNATGSAAEVFKIARAILALPERLGSKLELVERAVLHHAIESCGGNKSAAARLVGVHRKHLERKWDRLSARAPEEDDPPEES